MKTKAYFYTVKSKDGPLWCCIFDCDISKEEVIKTFCKETGSNSDGRITSYVIDYYQKASTLPEVTEKTLHTLEKDLLKEKWANNMFSLLSLNQPILYEYLRMSAEKHGEIVALIGLIIYRLLESQTEEKT